MFKKILVPVDGSKGSENALKLAIALAKQFRGELLILHAAEIAYGVMPPDYAAWSPVLFTEVTEAMRKRGNRIVNHAKSFADKEGVKAETRMEMASPVATICEVAEKGACDLIVMGSRGLSDFKGLFLGSVSHGVLQRSHCPVLLAKEPAAASSGKAGPQR